MNAPQRVRLFVYIEHTDEQCFVDALELVDAGVCCVHELGETPFLSTGGEELVHAACMNEYMRACLLPPSPHDDDNGSECEKTHLVLCPDSLS